MDICEFIGNAGHLMDSMDHTQGRGEGGGGGGEVVILLVFFVMRQK